MTIPSTHISLLRSLGEGRHREDAWLVFQACYREVILGWCRSRGLDRRTAEDLTQEILIKLLEALPRHEHNPDRGRFRSWLKTVVRHVLADHWRRQRHRLESGGVGGSTALEGLGDLPSPAAVAELGVAGARRRGACGAEGVD